MLDLKSRSERFLSIDKTKSSCDLLDRPTEHPGPVPGYFVVTLTACSVIIRQVTIKTYMGKAWVPLSVGHANSKLFMPFPALVGGCRCREQLSLVWKMTRENVTRSIDSERCPFLRDFYTILQYYN